MKVIVTTQPSAKVALPRNTAGYTGTIYCHEGWTIPMQYLGIEDTNVM